MVRAPAPGTGGSRVRFLPGPRAGVARCNLHFTATCAEQLAQSKLHRETCADQLAPQSALPRATCAEQLTQSNLHRATCTEQLAQSSLHRATCRERNLHRATCRDQLAGATCAEQLAQSNLHSATCVEQLAQTNLHRPVCAEHLAWCCLALASRSVGKKNASCSVGPTSLAMFCFRANRGLVYSGGGQSYPDSQWPREIWASGLAKGNLNPSKEENKHTPPGQKLKINFPAVVKRPTVENKTNIQKRKRKWVLFFFVRKCPRGP